MKQENNYELLVSGNDEICLFVHIALLSAGILLFQPSYLILGMIRE